jgi:hypothetical protein
LFAFESREIETKKSVVAVHVLSSSYGNMAAERLSPNNADSVHTNNYKKFISAFLNSHGALQILIVSTLYAISVGSVLGLVRYTFHRTSPKYLANIFFSSTITLLLTST